MRHSRVKEYDVYVDNEHLVTDTAINIAKKIGTTPDWIYKMLKNGGTRILKGKEISIELSYDPNDAIFALYKGEDIVSIGTLEDISKESGKKINTLKWYLTHTGKSRYPNGKNITSLVELED